MKKSSKAKLLALGIGTALAVDTLLSPMVPAESATNLLKEGKWVAGDFHNHTFFTDGNNTEKDVVENAFE